jgi:calcium-dependent protein kinase
MDIIRICEGGDVFDKVLEKGNLSIEEAFKVYI